MPPLQIYKKREPLKATLYFPKAGTIIPKKFWGRDRLGWECLYIAPNFTPIRWSVKTLANMVVVGQLPHEFVPSVYLPAGEGKPSQSG